MPDFAAHEAATDFNEQATPAPEKQAVTIALDADVVAWFQQQQNAGGIDWQTDMNGVLRFYMESTQAMLREPALEPYDMAADQLPDLGPR